MKVAVLMGGKSFEREVSLASGKVVCEALEEAGHKVVPLDTNADLVPTLRSERPDVVYNALHGKHGEDGTIQGLFQLAGIPFVGCDAISSANCMDKEMTHTIMEAHGIQMAKWLRVDNEKMQDFDAFAKQAEQKLGYPMFVKPANAGSSVGVGKAHDRAELKSACLHALQEDYKAVVEECIEMQEVETAVLGNSNPQAAGVVGELVPVGEF